MSLFEKKPKAPETPDERRRRFWLDEPQTPFRADYCEKADAE